MRLFKTGKNINKGKKDHFTTAYFHKPDELKEELKEIFQSETWNGDVIIELLKHHEVNPETFFSST